MLRNKNLLSLSRQHHHTLALCVRLDRALQAGPVDVAPWQAEIAQHFEQEVGIHFAAEESAVLPLAARFEKLQPLVAELLAEHELLRALFAGAAACSLDCAALAEFADKLSRHIRKEERQLFEGMQGVLGEAELDAMGAALEKALAASATACLIPNEATRLRPRTSNS